jgi:hypothetical protein
MLMEHEVLTEVYVVSHVDQIRSEREREKERASERE